MRLRTHARALALTLGGALCAAAARPAARPADAQPAYAAATPPSASAPAAWTGVFRVEARRGGELVPMRVVVERVGDRLGATLLVDNSATALERVRGDGEELRGTIATSAGRGELVLRATAGGASGGVTGTITVGKATWTVTGERTG